MLNENDKCMHAWIKASVLAIIIIFLADICSGLTGDQTNGVTDQKLKNAA